MYLRIRSVKWKRVLVVAAALAAVDTYCYKCRYEPGPVLRCAVGAYNGVQALRAAVPGPVGLWHRHKAKGPLPDARVVAASNAFGLRLLADLTRADPKHNVLFSPASISAATLMAANGAGGATQREIVKCLGLDGIDLPAANRAHRRIGELLAYSDPRIEARAANAIWADGEARVRADYTASMRRGLGAEVEVADLHAPETTQRISRWIGRQAGEGMADALPPPRPGDRLYLLSALAFRGEWASKFQASETQPSTFWLDDGTEVQVPMMNGKVDGEFTPEGAANGAFEAARLPYGDGSMSMLIVIPGMTQHGRRSLNTLLKDMTPSKWAEWTGGLHRESRYVALPRFRVESRPALAPALKRMGIRSAFRAGQADFRPMCDEPNGVFLSDAIHRARIEVDEEGARAQALTIEITQAAGGPAAFLVNGPFLCAIRDDRTGAILFMGAIYDPQPM